MPKVLISEKLSPRATTIFEEHGIALSTVRHDRQCDYETLLRVTISHKSGDQTIAGTLVGGNKPRIVEVQHIAVESDFPPHLLYLRNYDKPGFIGDLGSLCGKHGINIATFHLGRREAGGEAIALVEIDGGLPKTMLLKSARWIRWRAPMRCISRLISNRCFSLVDRLLFGCGYGWQVGLIN